MADTHQTTELTMNLPSPGASTTSQPVYQPGMQPATPPVEDDDEINFLDLLDSLLDQKYLIAAVAAIALALGAAYSLMATPIYKADSLIQIEDIKGNNPLGMIGDAGSLFDVKSPAAAEIEILRSRLVVGQAVSNLQLDLTVTPKYVPYIGGWLARGKTEPSEPGFMGRKGYVRGNENIRIAGFDVPSGLEGARFSVVLSSTGYELNSPEGELLGKGVFGSPLAFGYQGEAGQLTVSSAVGKPGAEFYIARRSTLAVTQGLQSAINVVDINKSSVLRLTLEGADPERITQVLNQVGTLYVRQNTDRRAAEAEKSLAFLKTQLPQLKERLETSEANFNQFRIRQGTFDLGGEASNILSQTVGLQAKVFELQAKRKELETRFTPKHPDMQAVDSAISDAKARLSDFEAKAKRLPTVEQDLLRLTRDVKADSELYTNLINSAQQLRLIKEGKVGNVRIIDVAVRPESPFKPNRSSVLAAALAMGLVAGLMLAFVRNSMRPGIKNAEVLEHKLGLSVFATVPLTTDQSQIDADMRAKKPGIHLLATRDPNSSAVESLRSLRTALQFAMLDAPNNMVLFTGPTPDIGKSFTSTNFAAVLVAAGQRVLLIDADLRKGYIHQIFGLARGVGLSELVAGRQDIDKVIHHDVLPGLDFISTGVMPPNPAELLMSAATGDLLKTLSARYDIVLVDTPPVLAVSDTAILAPHAGAIFLVVRAEVSSLGEVQESIKRIAQSGKTIKGVIFNGLDISKRRYGYGYGNGYKYKRYSYRYKTYGYGQDKPST